MSEAKEILGMEDVSGDESIKKLVDSLTNSENLEGKTDLNSNQIVAISRADWYGKHYESKAMQTIVVLICKYLQSKGRMGRRELVDTITGLWKYNIEKGKEQVKL